MYTKFTSNAIHIIKNIPEGNILTYGTIAILAGDPKGARQVSRVLHSLSEKHELPWHRVINGKGKISLTDPQSYDEQKYRLLLEGIEFSWGDRVDLDRFLWKIGSIKEIG